MFPVRLLEFKGDMKQLNELFAMVTSWFVLAGNEQLHSSLTAGFRRGS